MSLWISRLLDGNNRSPMGRDRCPKIHRSPSLGDRSGPMGSKVPLTCRFVGPRPSGPMPLNGVWAYRSPSPPLYSGDRGTAGTVAVWK